MSTPAPAPATYLQAIAHGLATELRRDERVFLLGEDIAAMGGAFKLTAGFLEEFGPQRVLDTPMAETAIVGACIGAALMGRRPIAEMQFSDFVTCAFNQIVNNAATWHWRTGTPLPFVLRLPVGGGISGGPFHSRSPEAWFAHAPGLKLVAPSTPEDAVGLLRAAVRDDNPVLFLEHKYLYRRQKAPLPAEDHVVPLGRAAVRRPGREAVVFTWGWMVHESLAAAEEIAADSSREVEVVDLRTLLPWDAELLLERTAACHRVLIVHEAPLTGGLGGELAAFLGEHAFEALDAPVRRLGAPDCPVPFAPALERAFLPDRTRIRAALEDLLTF